MVDCKTNVGAHVGKINQSADESSIGGRVLIWVTIIFKQLDVTGYRSRSGLASKVTSILKKFQDILSLTH